MKAKMRISTSIAGNPAPRMIATIIAIALVSLTTIAVSDPLSLYDEGLTATLIMKECSVDPSEFPLKDPSPEPKLRAIGDAAWRQLLAPLDEQDSAHHEENGHRADAELKKRSVADLAHVKELVSTKGCDALIPHARAVLESILQ